MKKWKALLSCTLLIGCATAAPAVSAAEVTDAAIDEALLPFDALEGATAHWGTIDGAGYRIEVPEDWNGELTINAPGFSGGEFPVIGNAVNREYLIKNGYAWAQTSYRTPAYDIETAAEDVKSLVDVFRSAVGAPEVVYGVGGSMGGHVIKHVVEEWPDLTAGALSLCGGDVELFDYFQDVHLVGETIAGNTPVVPSPADYAAVGLPALQAQLGPAFPGELNELGETFKDSVEMLSGGERPVYEQAWSGPLAFSGILIPQSLGSAGNGLDNTDTIYQLDTDPAISAEEQALNDAFVRVEGTAPHRTAEGWYPSGAQSAVDLTGDLDVPVLSMHTLGDLFVPFSMQQIYAQKVQAHGASDLLVTRAIREPNHCIFTAGEVDRAFADLVGWTKTGVKPAGDEVLDAGIVADPHYGCRFTEGASFTRVAIPACPKEWSAATVYDEGDEVVSAGVEYVAQWWTQNEKPGSSVTGSWMERGAPAWESGHSVRAWTSSWVYDVGDVVAHDGRAYEAKWWTRNQAPGDPHGPWAMIAD